MSFLSQRGSFGLGPFNRQRTLRKAQNVQKSLYVKRHEKMLLKFFRERFMLFSKDGRYETRKSRKSNCVIKKKRMKKKRFKVNNNFIEDTFFSLSSLIDFLFRH